MHRVEHVGNPQVCGRILISSFQVEISVTHVDGGKNPQNKRLHLAQWMGIAVLSCVAAELKTPSSLPERKSGQG